MWVYGYVLEDLVHQRQADARAQAEAARLLRLSRRRRTARPRRERSRPLSEPVDTLAACVRSATA
jgi:hypothetical protein